MREIHINQPVVNKYAFPRNPVSSINTTTFPEVKLSSSTPDPTPQLRQRSQSFSFTRQLYPPSLRSFRLSPSSPISTTATTTTTTKGLLPIINESDRPATADATRWDSLASGQMSPALSTTNFSSASSWFPGSVQKHHLGRNDVIKNIKAFEMLAKMSRQYEDALRVVSDASAQFAEALEQISKAKDLHRPDEEEEDVEEEEIELVEGFRSLSGYQYYMASQQRVLAQLVHEQCTSPLESQSQAYRNTLMVLKSLRICSSLFFDKIVAA